MKVPVERYWGLTAVDGVRFSGPAPSEPDPEPPPPASGVTAESGFVVSGTLAHGETVTITRAAGGLGAHPLSIHFAGGASGWIESMAGDGSASASDMGWTRGSSAIRTDTDATRGKVLSSTQTFAAANTIRRPITPWSPDNWQYATYWIRRDTFIPMGAAQRGQHKTIRFNDQANLTGTAKKYVATFTGRPDRTEGPSIYWPGYPEARPTNSRYHSSTPFGLLRDYLWPWVRMEVEVYGVRQADDANSVRTVRFRIPEVGIQQHSIGGDNHYCWTDADAADIWTWVTFQDYFGNGFSGSNCHIARDDLYVSSNSRARVEIVDGADFDTALWAEIQLPTTWADGQIAFECNFGGFGSLVGKKLYVVLNDGTALLVGTFT